jgi:checkpoint serine/threonine-protein kinase
VEPIAIYMTAELLGLLELLHSLQIVHADIKPDNFLVRHTPSTQSSPSLQVQGCGSALI